MKYLSSEQLWYVVILGLVAIFIFSGFYKQYVAVWTELFTFMMFFLSGVGLYIASKNSDKKR